MKKRSVLVAAALFAALLAPPAAAAPAGADVSPQDREYLQRTHRNNLFEIISGNLAERGGCARVRELGREFAAHHTVLDAELTAVATRHAVALYSVLDPDGLARIQDLSARSGPDFDTAWLHDQIAAHEEAIAVGEQEQRSGWSPEVKALAKSSEPILRHHLEQAVSALGVCAAG